MLKKLLRVGTLMVLLGPSAQAADFETPAAYDWSGFYLGGHVGYGWGDFGVDSESVGTSGTFDMDGVVGGGHIGYLFAIESLVIGPEFSLTWTDLNDDQRVGASDRQELSIDHLAILGGRVGWAMDRMLFYVRGGYATGEIEVGETLTTGDTTFSRRETKRHDGYAIGGGLEYGLSENFTVGAEYMFIDLGEENYDGPIGPAIAIIDVDAEIHMVTGRVSFRFGGL
jgi:outer membrane immunogenic protein